MKLILLSVCALSLGIFILSCRKEEPHPIPDNWEIIDKPFHCTNGITDEGETGQDCGGTCPVCETIEIPCDNTSNEISLGPDEVSLNASCVSGVFYTLSGKSATGDSLLVRFPTKPTNSKIYSVVSSTVPGTDQVYVEWYSGVVYYTPEGGEAYVNLYEEGISVDFCELLLATSGLNPDSLTISANINCD